MENSVREIIRITNLIKAYEAEAARLKNELKAIQDKLEIALNNTKN